MIIGNFTYDQQADTYSGEITLLTLEQRGVKFKPVEKSASEQPDYRVIFEHPSGRDIEFGAAWKRRSDTGREFLSVMIDDPTFAAPLNAALFLAEDGESAALVWNRRKAKAEASAADASARAKPAPKSKAKAA